MVSIVTPSICHEVMVLNAMILVFWMLSFKPSFSLSSFTFIKRLFSSSPSAIQVVSSAYLRLLIFLLEISWTWKSIFLRNPWEISTLSDIVVLFLKQGTSILYTDFLVFSVFSVFQCVFPFPMVIRKLKVSLCFAAYDIVFILFFSLPVPFNRGLIFFTSFSTTLILKEFGKV